MDEILKILATIVACGHAVIGQRHLYRKEWIYERCVLVAKACAEHSNPVIVALRFSTLHGDKLLTIDSPESAKYFVDLAAENAESEIKEYIEGVQCACDHSEHPHSECVDGDGDGACDLHGEPQEKTDVDPVTPKVETEPPAEVKAPEVTPDVKAPEVKTETTETKTEELVKKEEPSQPQVDISGRPISDLDVSASVKKVLTDANIHTIGDLLKMHSETGLEPLPFIGKVTEARILEAVEKLKG